MVLQDDQEGDAQTAPSLWKDTDYGWWLAADTSASVSSDIVSFVIPLIILSASGSAALASSMDALQVAVLCVLGLAGGVIQDRYDRKKLMLLEGGALVVLYLLSSAVLIASDVLHNKALVWLLVPILVLAAVRDGLLGNTSNVMLRGIVPDDQLPKAMSLNDGRDAVVGMASGPIGGALMSIGRAVPFLTGACCGLIALLTTSRITRYWHRGAESRCASADTQTGEGDARNTDESEKTTTEPPKWREAFAGLRWLFAGAFQRRLTIASMIVTGGSNAFLTITTLEVSEGGHQAASAGFVNASVACGMLLGAVVASAVVQRMRGGVLVALAFVTLAMGFVGAALSPSTPAKAVFLVLSVLFLPAGNAVLGGFANILVAQDKLGRVGAGSSLAQYGSYGLCVLFAGIGMQYVGYSATCWVLAAMLAAVAVYVLSMRALITLPAPGRWADHIQQCRISRFE
ncbi:MFS transporter [Bifidobacterium ruminantium]|uniref:MFS transporter n=1 Tax=Bifidobacterium ruminantium TaxID=78346 RepID=UPI002490A098|nr:MFS transporter [Bifidobacterium ruminantium]